MNRAPLATTLFGLSAGTKIAAVVFGGIVTSRVRSFVSFQSLTTSPRNVLVSRAQTLSHDNLRSDDDATKSRRAHVGVDAGQSSEEPSADVTEKMRIATEEEFRQVLSNLEVLRIRGEFNTGADTGWLDNVRFERVPK
jgi:hypothetical protein